MSGSATLRPSTVAEPVRSQGHRRHRRARSRVRMPLAVTAATQAVWLFWWAATDHRAPAAGYGGADPYGLYTAALRGSVRLAGGAGPLALAQTTLAALALGYTAAALARLGTRARWTAPTALLLAAAPPTGAFVVALAPDVPSTVCAVLATAAALRLLARRADGTLDGRGPVLRLDLLVLAAALLGLGTLHPHGPLVVLLTAVPLLLLLGGARRRIALATAVAVVVPVVLGIVRIPGVHRPPAHTVHALRLGDLAVAYHRDPGAFTAAERADLAAAAPLADWDLAGERCYRAPEFTGPADQWTTLLGRRPDLVLAARLCRGQLAWSVGPGPAELGGATGVAAPGTTGGPLGRAAAWLHTAFRVPQLDWLLWRGATWSWIACAALLVHARRHRLPAALPVGAAVLLAVQAGLLATATGQDHRTMAPALFLGPLLLTLVTAPRRRNA
ncbi:hypothetical protein [Kitasatospora terrestris]|uniref:Glycosyltransferase RgtA/B/C/D-like domain-containing protein n=1 Tax=Kitasatospora terrestris TaxID=258051 RepID=A0ABP9DRE1_9ACTN